MLKNLRYRGSLMFILLCLFSGSCRIDKTETGDETDKRIEILLARMTLDEKIGQMTQMCLSSITLNGDKNLDMNPDLFRKAILEQDVGSLISATGPAEKWITFVTELQRVAMEESRLKIPLLIGIDHVHGANYIDEGTIFPHNINLGCSFDTSLVSLEGKLTAEETLRAGITWNFAPVVDIGINSYWPRFYETYGEDPLLCGTLGSAFIRALQSVKGGKNLLMTATAKHFIGYSDPKSGWDRTPAEIPDQWLYEEFLPPFRMAIKAGVKTLMVNSGEVNGIPVHVSKKLLTGLLRNQLDFKGVIVTDIKDIYKVYDEHGAAESEKEATFKAIEAGIDINMACNSYDFITIVRELVTGGRISESRIDSSVRRILRLKYEIGLFENPYPVKKEKWEEYGTAHKDISRRMAENSIVLLKNKNDILPLDGKPGRILVSGPGAVSRRMMNGGWTLDWMGAEEQRQPRGMKTLAEALREALPGKNISVYLTGADGEKYNETSFKASLSACELVILALGEQPYSEFKGNLSDLSLDCGQLALVQTAHMMGKKIILILLEGRPRVITGVEPWCDAILFAGYPGEKGPEALAGILAGEVNPSARLAFSYPAHPGHAIPYYHKNKDVSENLFDFGSGLSFTRFSYSGLKLSDSVFSDTGKSIHVTMQIKNSGKREGRETMLVFFRDEKGSITRPVRQLFHFEKIDLDAGQEKTVDFSFVPSEIFSFPDENNHLMIEPGEFTIMVGGMQKTLLYKTEL